MRKASIAFVFFLVIAASGQAQFKSQQSGLFKASELVRKPAGLFAGLINPAKFSMSQMISVSFFSAGNQAFNQGLYLNTMRYRFSDPLLAQVQIGYLHQQFGGRGISGNSNGTLFLRSATLDYRPSEKVSVRFDYETLPSNGYYQGGLR